MFMPLSNKRIAESLVGDILALEAFVDIHTICTAEINMH